MLRANRFEICSLLLVTVIVISPQAVLAESVQLIDVADGYMRSGGGSSGTADELRVGYGSSAGGFNNSAIRFSLSSLPANVTIDSATLYCWAFGAYGGLEYRNINVHAAASSWTEQTITWGVPSTGTFYDQTSVGGPTQMWFTWDVTDLVRGWHSGAIPDYGVVLSSSETTPENRMRFHSREYTDSSRRPYIYVIYTPADSDGPFAPQANMSSSFDHGASASDQITFEGNPEFNWNRPADRGNSGTADYYQYAVTNLGLNPWTHARLREGYTNDRHVRPGSVPDGAFTFWVQAQDNVGNWGDWGDLNYYVDTVPPLIPTGLANPSNPTADTTPNLSWLGDDNAGGSGVWVHDINFHSGPGPERTFQSADLTLDDVDYQGIELEEGSWQWRVRTIDIAGNTSDWSLSTAILISTDSSPPTIQNWNVFNDGMGQVTVQLEATDATGVERIRIEYSADSPIYDQEAWMVYQGNQAWEVTLPVSFGDGTYLYLRAWAEDQHVIPNSSTTNYPYNPYEVVIDSSSPLISNWLVSYDGAGNVTVRLQASDDAGVDHVHLEYSNNSQTYDLIEGMAWQGGEIWEVTVGPFVDGDDLYLRASAVDQSPRGNSATEYYPNNPYAVTIVIHLTVDLSTEFQEIDGFGASLAFWGYNPNDMALRLATLDLGTSIIRTQGDQWADPAEWNKCLDVLKKAHDQFRVNTFLLTFWTPPNEYLIPGERAWNNTGTNAQDWASAIAGRVAEFRTEIGPNARIYVSPQNEPNYSSNSEPYTCSWDAEDLGGFIAILRTALSDNGLIEISIVSPEATKPSSAIPYIANMQNQPDRPDVFAYHLYRCQNEPDYPNLNQLAPYHTWQTETSGLHDPCNHSWDTDDMDDALRAAELMHRSVCDANSSAFLWWGLTWAEHSYRIDPNQPPQQEDADFDRHQGLILVDHDQDPMPIVGDPNMPIGSVPKGITKKYFTFRHFARFIGAEYIRVSISDGSPLLTSAYKKQDNAVVVVIIVNPTADPQNVSLNGLPSLSLCAAVRTTGGLNCEPIPGGWDGSVPGESVTTLVYRQDCDPTIVLQPQGTEVCEGEDATFNIDISGCSVVEYAWSRDGQPVGTDSPVLVLEDVEAADDGTIISCAVTDDCGMSVSETATLTVHEALSITAGPDDAVACESEAASFSVAVNGGGTLSFQWLKDGSTLDDGQRIIGSNTATLLIDPIIPDDIGDYTVEVSGDCGAPVLSLPGALTVNGPPSISEHPQGQTACEGEQVTLNVTLARGDEPLSFEWRKGESPIPAAPNQPSYTIESAGPDDDGEYSVNVTNACGEELSHNAMVTVVPTPPTPPQPIATPSMICDGESTTLSTSVPGLQIQWYLQPAGGDPFDVGDSIVVSPMSTTTYYAESRSLQGDCVSSARAAVAVMVTPFSLGDLNCDGNFDVDDRIAFEGCYSGENNPLPADCEAADLDADGDADCDDWELLRDLTGGGFRPVLRPCLFDQGPPLSGGTESSTPASTDNDEVPTAPTEEAESPAVSTPASTPEDCGAGMTGTGAAATLSLTLLGFIRRRRH